MSSWNHRVVRVKCKDGIDYAIHEAYYTYDGGISWTENPIPASVFIWEDNPSKEIDQRAINKLRSVLKDMLAALDRPIIETNEVESETE